MAMNALAMRDDDNEQPRQRAQEGFCTACGAPVSEHVRKGGKWRGCVVAGATAPTRLILVPDRRDHVTAPVVERRAVSTISMVRPVTVPPVSAQVAYVALYPLMHPRVKAVASERDRGIYRLLARTRNGLTRADLLRKLNTRRTGIVDGALRRLRMAGVIDRIGIE